MKNKAAVEARKKIQIHNTVGAWCQDTPRWNFPLMMVLIEVPDIENEQNDEVDDLEISLHAIRGTCNSSTMQLPAKVSGKIVLVLVDSGNTHNFLCEGLVPRLGLKIQKKRGLQFVVANDNFQADFYTIPLEGFDMILGVKWLCTLGPILWDFSSLIMQFVVNKKKILWQGQPPEEVPRLSLIQ
ncbi:hypothetical protein GOBAR_AA02408 [Gossypium barbadense]|uniref:Aspartic peptidase DDI1-type domain-containing protein n=1 Tax=Gossypium barbadense TaxID=3634 RepID=A0A2P5YRH6_GOSBA|nr:hypothetical protein GOBAR_AA02408 [Gossypium barbadense]